MSNESLPDDWSDLPLDDPHLVGNAIDLLVSDRDRCARSVALLLCDGAHRLLQPMCMTGVPRRTCEDDRRASLALLAALSGLSLVAVVARPRASPTDAEVLAWARTIRSVCVEHGIELIGTWLATPEAIRCVSLRPAA